MWFQKKRAAPVKVPTDTVIPLWSADDTDFNRTVVVTFMLKFDDVLDPEKLGLSLEKLISRPGWRKLGARLRENERGKLDYHVPADFSPKRPPFSYSHVNYDIEMAEHPIASRIPKATSRPAVVADTRDFVSLVRRPDGPTKVDDYLYTDEPQLSLHIVSFQDATLVSLSWLHTFLDAMGRKALLDAWTLVLQGRDDEVKDLYGVYEDPLLGLGTRPTEPYRLIGRILSAWKMLVFAILLVWELLWYCDETRVVCVPAHFIKEQRQQVLDEAINWDCEKPFVSEGDVLSAWWTRQCTWHLNHESTCTVMLMNAFGLRSILANDLLPSNRPYIANASFSVVALISVRDLFHKPLAYAALAVRRSIAELGTREQIEAYAALNREAAEAKGNPPLFGDGTMHMFVISNWTKARFFDVDFSAALVRPGATDGGRSNKMGTPSYVNHLPFCNGFLYSPRNSCPILGKDAEGNYWLVTTLRKGLWDKIEDRLYRDSS